MISRISNVERLLAKTARPLAGRVTASPFYRPQFYGQYRMAASPFSATPQQPTEAATAALHESHRARQQEHLDDIIEGNLPQLQTVKHPKVLEALNSAQDAYATEDKSENYTFPHAIWTDAQTKNVAITHVPPKQMADYMAYASVTTLRLTWDLSTGYLFGHKLRLFKFSEHNWLLRVCYLETVAGVPGMMFGMVRHLNSLRHMRRDHGWIHTLLAEAENERMHLLTFLKLYEPSKPFRYCVVGAQFIMSNFLFISYMLSPRYCHKFVGYLEEEAVKTYTGLLKEIDSGNLPDFEKQCSPIARGYWQLGKNATWRDVFAQVLADEAQHRDVNHTLAPLAANKDAKNPFRNGK